MPVAVPARFIDDHWCPHSSMRVRAAALRVIMSSGAAGEGDRPGVAIAGARDAIPGAVWLEGPGADFAEPAVWAEADATITQHSKPAAPLRLSVDIIGIGCLNWSTD